MKLTGCCECWRKHEATLIMYPFVRWPWMFSPKLLRTLSETIYVLFVLFTVVAIALSCAAILSQAVRTSPNQDWRNSKVLVIGASYLLVVRWVSSLLRPLSSFFFGLFVKRLFFNFKKNQIVVSLLLCVKRRIAVRLELQRISKRRKMLGQGDLPKVMSLFPYPLRRWFVAWPFIYFIHE